MAPDLHKQIYKRPYCSQRSLLQHLDVPRKVNKLAEKTVGDLEHKTLTTRGKSMFEVHLACNSMCHSYSYRSCAFSCTFVVCCFVICVWCAGKALTVMQMDMQLLADDLAFASKFHRFKECCCCHMHFNCFFCSCGSIRLRKWFV